MAKRRLALTTADRLRHVHVKGPTGSSKSNLLGNMALQDIDAGYGACLIDPKGDLLTDVAARIPANRIEDLVVLDPSETSRAVRIGLVSAERRRTAQGI
jgi:DNA helicase HerA-like ATPase